MSGTKATTLTAKILPQNATNKNIGWTSSNDKIATVTQNGRITARKNGTVTITATSKSNNNKKATCKVTVKTSPTSVKLNEKSLQLDIKSKTTKTLIAVVQPQTSTDKNVKWTSSNTKVAKVTQNGKVVAKKEGTTTITVKTSNGKTTKCNVRVTTFPASYIEHMRQKIIYYDSKTKYGCVVDTDKCRVTIFKKVNGKWKLAKDSKGYCTWNSIQGVKSNILPDCSWNGPRSRSFKGVYKIRDKVKNSGGCTYLSCFICYNHCPHNGTGDLCQRFEASNWGDPDKVKNRYHSHGCSNLRKDRAKWIYDNIPIGSTVIVFDKYNPMPKWNEWDTAQSCTTKKSNDLPKSISVTPTNIELKIGQTRNLKATINPTNATYKGLSWKSSNTNVVTVDKKGKINAKSKGTATITVRTSGKVAKCKIIVK